MPKSDDPSALVPTESLMAVQWPAPPGVHAAMTTRLGGVSVSPFDSFNLGAHVNDDASAVATNRSRLAQALQARPVFLKQVHGVHCASLLHDTPDGTVADACITASPGLVCTVMVADCLPVLLVDRDGRTVGAAHAGWRGLAGAGESDARGVLEVFYETFKSLALFNKEEFAISRPVIREPRANADSGMEEGCSDGFAPDCMAWLGPCIGPTAFEVGADVRDAFLSTDLSRADVIACFEPVRGSPGKYLASLAELARLRLRQLGVKRIEGNDGSDPWCTVTQSSLWFSHRRDALKLGSTGRMAACIWRD